jgi:metal-sulfur cluster biosynthetic enzyme
LADAREKEMNKKLGTIGNIVHDSVPVSNNEVRRLFLTTECPRADLIRTTMRSFVSGLPKASRLKSGIVSPTTMFCHASMAMNLTAESRS